MVDMGISSNTMKSPLPNVTWHSGTWSSTVTPLTDQTLHQFWTYHRAGPYYQFWPYYQISEGFHRTLQRVRLANRGRLLLQTPGPVPFGTCICSNLLRPFFPELVMSTDLLSFEHPSVLLFCCSSTKLQAPFVKCWGSSDVELMSPVGTSHDRPKLGDNTFVIEWFAGINCIILWSQI